MMIDWLGSLLRAKTVIPPMLTAGGRAEVGERDPGRAVGVGRQEVGRLPDSAAGTGRVDRVARGIGGIDRRPAPTDAAGPAPADRRRRADRCPRLARQGVGLAEREDTEARRSRCRSCSPRPVVGSGFWKLSDQLLNVPVLRSASRRGGILDHQCPCPLTHSRPAKAVPAASAGRTSQRRGLLPFWIGVADLSSKIVLVKLAVLVPLPTPLNNGTST